MIKYVLQINPDIVDIKSVKSVICKSDVFDDILAAVYNCIDTVDDICDSDDVEASIELHSDYAFIKNDETDTVNVAKVTEIDDEELVRILTAETSSNNEWENVVVKISFEKDLQIVATSYIFIGEECKLEFSEVERNDIVLASPDSFVIDGNTTIH